MSRAKNLNEIEQFYFDKNYNSLPLPTLAEQLGRPEKFIQKLVDKKRAEPKQEFAPQASQVSQSPPETAPTPPPQSKMPNTQFNITLGRRKNPDGSFQKDGPIVMTESASMVGDEALAKSKKNYVSPRLAQSIFKMRPDE